MTNIFSLLPGVLYCLIALYLCWYVLRFLTIWIGAYFFLTALVVLMLLMIYGVVGTDLGVQNLFIPHIVMPPAPVQSTQLRTTTQLLLTSWDAGGNTQFNSAIALMMLFLGISIIAYVLDRRELPVWDLRRRPEFAELEKKRDRLTDPFRSAVSDFRWVLRRIRGPEETGTQPQGTVASLWLYWIWTADMRRRAFSSASRGRDEKRDQQTTFDLIWRPCVFLFVLSAVPAFLNIWGWAGVFTESAWWWIVGLIMGLVLPGLVLYILLIWRNSLIGWIRMRWQALMARPAIAQIRTRWQALMARPPIAQIRMRWQALMAWPPIAQVRPILERSITDLGQFLLLWVMISVLVGAAVGFRNAGDLSAARIVQGGTETEPSGLALIVNLLLFAAVLALMERFRRGLFPSGAAGHLTWPGWIGRACALLLIVLVAVWISLRWLRIGSTLADLALLPWLARLSSFLAVGSTVGFFLWCRKLLEEPPQLTLDSVLRGISLGLLGFVLWGIILGLLGFVLFGLSYRWWFNWETPRTVSVLICLLVGLLATVYAALLTVTPTLRLLIAFVFLAFLFAANGTNWTSQRVGPADDYKMQFERLHRDTPSGTWLASYYDYPVRLESKAYLDRSYLKPASIVNASNSRPIEITSAYAHGLRYGDRVRITGVHGNPAANGTFVVIETNSAPNKFTLAATEGCGDYTFGGEWIIELDEGRIIDARPEPGETGRATITSHDHGLETGENGQETTYPIRLMTSDGTPFEVERRGENPRRDKGFTARTRPASDARSGSQFLVEGIEPKRLAELRNGRWFLDPDSPEQHPRRGGVAWVTNDSPTFREKAASIIITTSDPVAQHAGSQPTPDHGVQSGQHILVDDVAANPDANGIWTVYRIDANHLELRDSRLFKERHTPNPREFLDLPPTAPMPPAGTRSDWMSGGSWRVVTDRGRIIDVSNDPGKPIRITSLSHGLRTGDHVEITGVMGNTRANGLWTVNATDGNKDSFELMGPNPHELNTASPLTSLNRPLAAHEAEGGPKFTYRGGGLWQRVPDRGRLFATRHRPGRVEFYSPQHHLVQGTVVEINGLDEGPDQSRVDPSQPPRLNGQLFRVLDDGNKNNPDWFGFEVAPPPGNKAAVQGVAAAPEDNTAAPTVLPVVNPAASWSISYGCGPVMDVKWPEGRDVVILSPKHGLQEGDHVRFSGSAPDLARLSGLYSVHLADKDEDRFALGGTAVLSSTARRESPVAPYSGMATRGRWERVHDRGPVELVSGKLSDAQVPAQDLIVRAPKHGLSQNSWVAELLTGPQWAEQLVFSIDVAGTGADSFRLAGTKGIRQGTGEGDPRLSGSWRRLSSPAELIRSAKWLVASEVKLEIDPKTKRPKHLSITSPGHGLQEGDRIRLMRIGLNRDGPRSLGEQFTDTFAVSEIKGSTFQVPIYEIWTYRVHSSGMSSIELLNPSTGSKSQMLICAWRPIINRGVIDDSLKRVDSFFTHPGYGKIDSNTILREDEFKKKVESDVAKGEKEKESHRYEPAARVTVPSTRHGLANGTWLFMTGYPELGPGPFRIIDRSENSFDIEVIGKSIPKQLPPRKMARWKVVDLLEDQEVLANWSDRQQALWFERLSSDQRGQFGPPPKPKLAIVTVSGGGIRSAIWTANVLSRLEKELLDFPYRTRLITGASGGMVGAALYVGTLTPPEAGTPANANAAAQGRHGVDFSIDPTKPNPIIEALAKDQLTRVVSQLVLSDLASMLWPQPWGTDRGMALESTWWVNTPSGDPKLPRHSPFALPIRSLAVGELDGWRPSLVFAPMLVEDGRRILISNLNLDFVPRNVGHVLFARGTDKLSTSTKLLNPRFQSPMGDFDLYSLSALEFFRVFPDAHDFRLSTAARMSAAFPLITPAVSLPTVPARRVVDAGYYDNYGVNLAALWVFHNRDWLFEYTSGVVLIQVRDSQSERGRRELEDPDTEPSGGLIRKIFRSSPFSSWILDGVDNLMTKTQRGAQWLTSPIEGLSTARQSNMSFRNDEQVEVLSDVINVWPDSPVRGRGFFTTVVFECPKEASLNWVITRQEQDDIEKGFDPDQIDPTYSAGARRNLERLRMLMNWWNR